MLQRDKCVFVPRMSKQVCFWGWGEPGTLPHLGTLKFRPGGDMHWEGERKRETSSFLWEGSGEGVLPTPTIWTLECPQESCLSVSGRRRWFAALDTAVSACVSVNMSVPEGPCGSLLSYTLSV